MSVYNARSIAKEPKRPSCSANKSLSKAPTSLHCTQNQSTNIFEKNCEYFAASTAAYNPNQGTRQITADSTRQVCRYSDTVSEYSFIRAYQRKNARNL